MSVIKDLAHCNHSTNCWWIELLHINLSSDIPPHKSNDEHNCPSTIWKGKSTQPHNTAPLSRAGGSSQAAAAEFLSAESALSRKATFEVDLSFLGQYGHLSLRFIHLYMSLRLLVFSWVLGWIKLNAHKIQLAPKRKMLCQDIVLL